MRTIYTVGLAILLTAAPACLAQEPVWEVGGAAGFGLYRNASISSCGPLQHVCEPSGSAAAGFDDRFAAGVVIGQDRYEHFSGEIRYTFRDGDLRLSQGGQKVNMDGDSHALHYDMLFHLLSRKSRLRPYAAAGAGIKLFRATGKEYASQPFSDFALLTRTDEVKPLISVGCGVKYVLGSAIAIRIDFRDYITPFPEKLFAVANGAKIHGWLNDFVPLLGLSFVF